MKLLSMDIKLSTVQDVQEFIKITTRFEEEIVVNSGHFRVDGKSIMGLFSLDLSKVVNVTARFEDEKRADALRTNLYKFKV